MPKKTFHNVLVMLPSSVVQISQAHICSIATLKYSLSMCALRIETRNEQ